MTGSRVPRLEAAIPNNTPTVVASCSWLRYRYKSVAERQLRCPAWASMTGENKARNEVAGGWGWGGGKGRSVGGQSMTCWGEHDPIDLTPVKITLKLSEPRTVVPLRCSLPNLQVTISKAV